MVSSLRYSIFGSLSGKAVCALLCALNQSVQAQQLDPRAYSNIPIGANFLTLGYSYSSGNVALDPSLPITNVRARFQTAALGYSRALQFNGQSGVVTLVLPYVVLSATGDVFGESMTRNVGGVGDPGVRVSANLYGAPALSLEDYSAYRQGAIIGVSLLTTAPLGQYDASKLVNIGSNRWSFKSEAGASVPIGDHWTLEGAPSVTLFTDNRRFFNGNTRSESPLYAVQGHLIYNFKQDLWIAADGTYYAGGRTTLNGKLDDDLQRSSRWGATLSQAVDRQNSIKLYFSKGLYARTGSQFQTIGVAWQFSWFSQ
jgi:hypothetical protein